MCSVNKEDGALPRPGLGSARLQLLHPVARWHVGIGFVGEPADTPTAEREFFWSNSRPCVSLRWMPVSASSLFCASLLGAGGEARK